MQNKRTFISSYCRSSIWFFNSAFSVSLLLTASCSCATLRVMAWWLSCNVVHSACRRRFSTVTSSLVARITSSNDGAGAFSETRMKHIITKPYIHKYVSVLLRECCYNIQHRLCTITNFNIVLMDLDLKKYLTLTLALDSSPDLIISLLQSVEGLQHLRYRSLAHLYPICQLSIQLLLVPCRQLHEERSRRFILI